jgi:hypothetical protein
MEKIIETMLKKAGAAYTSVEALQYTQAACNAANALTILKALPRSQKADTGK